MMIFGAYFRAVVAPMNFPVSSEVGDRREVPAAPLNLASKS
jgi:hypothetical protein